MAATAQTFETLLAHVAAFEFSPALPVAWPEVAFDPATDALDGKYLQVALFTNEPRWQGLAAGRIDQGLLQVTVVWPKDEGLIAPAAVADAIKDHFARGTPLAGVKISGEPWAAAPISEDDRVSIPVTIRWTA